MGLQCISSDRFLVPVLEDRQDIKEEKLLNPKILLQNRKQNQQEVRMFW